MFPIHRIAAATSVALVAAGLGVAAAPAGAAPTAGQLAWEISQQFDDHLSTHELTDGATEAEDGVITFPGGTGTLDPATGAGTVQYDGAVTGAFVMGVAQYQVTIADPAVTVEEDGDGQITALVSASNIASVMGPAASTDPKRVVVTTFDADGGWAGGSLAATPHWTGVLPEGPESVALGIGSGKPVEGKAFAPSFLGQLTPGVRAHFYGSGASSDPKKAPAAFTAQAPEASAAPQVTATTSYADAAVRIAVSGTGFTAVTQPGDMGVYVGLAPAGGMPGDSQEDMDEFADAEWVSPAQMPDGSWSVTLDPATADLRRGTDYAIYTWQAHTHSNPNQDTETPVAIDWSKLRAPVTLSVDVTKKPTTRKAGLVAIDLGAGTTGKILVVLRKGSKTELDTSAKLRKGAATVRLPKVVKGKHVLTVRYLGTPAFQPAKKSLTFRVR